MRDHDQQPETLNVYMLTIDGETFHYVSASIMVVISAAEDVHIAGLDSDEPDIDEDYERWYFRESLLQGICLVGECYYVEGHPTLSGSAT